MVTIFPEPHNILTYKTMDITINVNGLKVLQDGSLVVSKEQSISFFIKGLTFVFDFREDDSGDKNSVIQEPNGNIMVTHLINFKNALGAGLKEPAEMATLGTGEKLYFSFAVYSISENPRVFHYTWFIGPKLNESESHE